MTNYNILAVDDNENNLLAIKRPLRKAGYNLFLTSNVKEAYAVLETENIHLILLDWMMPETSGLEFLKQIRNNDNYKEIAVIMLTAKSDLGGILKCKDLWIDGYILKPFYAATLLEQVEKVFNAIQVKEE